MTELVYLSDSYRKTLQTSVVSVTRKGSVWLVVLSETIFFPVGGGQPSDKGTLKGASGTVKVTHVRMEGDTVFHECATAEGLKAGEKVTCQIDWPIRYHHMCVHSAGHIVHEAVMAVSQGLVPLRGEHGEKPFIQYSGSIPIDRAIRIESEANRIVEKNLTITTEFVSLAELTERSSFVPPHLPSHKPLRIMTIDGYKPVPDGGTQVAKTGEVGSIRIDRIENEDNTVRVYYSLSQAPQEASPENRPPQLSAAELIGQLLSCQQNTLSEIAASSGSRPDELTLLHLGGKSELGLLTKQVKKVDRSDRQRVGLVVNEVKHQIEKAIAARTSERDSQGSHDNWFDVTAPGTRPPEGHLHIVSQAITEITAIFSRIGFSRVRHPEVDWDWYPFESLNMPPDHPARDEWETFFVQYPGKPGKDPKRKKIVLTPHTSNGQVREMEKGKLPIRMINIAKCYRRQIDVSHTPMFHQFEGLYVDRNVSIGHLKGVLNYFVKQFFGPERVARIRPFHFQFTEPSFEVDISCGVCLGKGCKLCKAGWLELGGAGMVHPVVLTNGGIDPREYSGFAFGWGVERTSMMKSGTKLDDIRLLYSNDVRFLRQF